MNPQRSIYLPEHDEDTNCSQEPRSRKPKDNEDDEEIPKPEEAEQEPNSQDEQTTIEETMGIGSRLPA